MASRTVGTSKSSKAKHPRLHLTLTRTVARECERSKVCVSHSQTLIRSLHVSDYCEQNIMSVSTLLYFII